MALLPWLTRNARADEAPTPQNAITADEALHRLQAVESVVRQGGADLTNRAVIANVQYNVSRIASAQPIVADAVRARIKGVGAVYQLQTGEVRAV